MDIDGNSRVLVVASHPDDEVLAMGGTIARFKDVGATVMVHFLGEGVSARFRPEEYGSDEFILQGKVRENSARRALKILKVDQVKFGDRLCCRFDSEDNLDIVKEIEQQISEFKPTHLFTHNPIEVNIDHRLTYLAVEAAVRPKIGLSLKGIYSFEIVCSGNWTFDNQFKPNIYVDIENYWQDKIEAWRCYQGEARPFPFPRSDQGLETLAKFRGMQCGLMLAEGFKTLRMII